MEAAVRWSPHSTGDRQRFLLVDVADSSLTLHEATSISKRTIEYHKVAQHGKLPNFSAFDWSKTNESIVALGLVSGNASLVQLNENSVPSETVATLRIKQQRKCNSIAFSSQNWLAVALDKTRSDVCLNIYDAGSDSANFNDPIRRLCAAELVSSVRFLPRQPQEVILAANRSAVRIYDLRDPHTSSAPSLSASTKNVNNIAIDPLDDNCFASGGPSDDPSVTVWDRRWLAHASGGSNTGAVFDFRPVVDDSVRTTVWSLRYSGLRRGRLAVCSSTGELKIIDMVEGRSHLSQSSEYMPGNPHGGTNWTCNRYVSETKDVEHAWHDPRHRKSSNKRIVAFDWMNEGSANSEQGMLLLRPDRSLDVAHATVEKPKAVVTARHELSLTLEDISHTAAKPASDSAKPSAPYEEMMGVAEAEDFGPLHYSGELGASFSEDAAPVCAAGDARIAKILSPGTIQRERCRRGYLWDFRKNTDIVTGNWQLERLWEIVNRFQEQAADDGMVFDGVDFSYIGVHGLWEERLGNAAKRMTDSHDINFEDTVVGLNESRELPPFVGERTDFPEHRQLCLAVCGWKFTTETLEAECHELIDRGLYYQAIVQAVLHEDKRMGINLLRVLVRSKTIPQNGIGALLATDELNETQREMCLWMSADTDDPALKALLTFLTNGDWRDVMKTNYLHLGYRVALGLKYLNDTELSGFIQSETARAIRNGDLEGILLTGLGEQAMDLFQTYLTRTNDLQTAVLATGLTNPLYVDDVRWDMWRETYFQQMQSWRCFNERTKFTIQHSRMARSRDGQTLVKSPPAQVTLRCTNCQTSLAKHDSRFLHGTAPKALAPPKLPKAKAPAAHAGTVCGKCGKHMPRCAICMLWLGTPDPRSRPSSGRANSEGGGGSGRKMEGQLKMGEFETFCVRCGHGYHAEHARRWFERHEGCAVPGCGCLCGLRK